MCVLRLLVVCGLLALPLGCGKDPLTPEERVRWTVDEMATAAELGDVSLLAEFVSDGYQDARGQGKRELRALVAYHVMRHPDRHVLAHVHDVVMRDDGRAEVVVTAGTAGSGAGGLRGDVYELDLDFVNEDGDWRLSWAQWRPAL